MTQQKQIRRTLPPAHPGPRKRRAPNGTQRFLRISVHLPPDLIAALDAQANADGLYSRSNLIRRACEQMLRRIEKRTAREDPEQSK